MKTLRFFVTNSFNGHWRPTADLRSKANSFQRKLLLALQLRLLGSTL